MKRLQLSSPKSRLSALEVAFAQNRHRYSWRRRATIEDLLRTASTDLQVSALSEALEAWLPQIEPRPELTPLYPRALAA